MRRMMRKKVVILFLLLIPLIAGLAFPQLTFAQEGEQRIEELEKKLEELEKQVKEYKALLKEVLEAKEAEKARKIIVEKAVVTEKKEKHYVRSKFDVQLGGRIKIDTHYDTVAFDAYNDFLGVVSSKPNYKGDSINFNPRDTRFELIVRHNSGNLTGTGRIETDFYGGTFGNNIAPRIRLAYVDIVNNKTHTSFRVGQDWVPVAQQNPHMCEFGIMAGGGNLWWRIPQITLRQKYGDFEFLASLMRHRRVSVYEEQWSWPWILGRVAYNLHCLDNGSLIALGGGYMTDKRSMLDGNRVRLHRWLTAFEYKFRKHPFELKGEVWVGQGIGSHWLRYDMGYNPMTGEEIRSQGGFVSLLYQTPIKKLAFAGGFGIDHATTSDLKGWDFKTPNYDFYKRRFKQNLEWFGNVRYKLTEGITLILEYIHMNTMRDEVREGNRITFSTFYRF